MKKIQEIIQRKAKRDKIGGRKELDEKTLARVFFEAAKEEVKNLSDEDIREIWLKNKNLYIKTAHPAVSSELLLRQRRILKKTNEIAGKEEIEKMIIS